MQSEKCANCYHRDNCGAAGSNVVCNSYLSAAEMYEDEMERNRSRKELLEYTKEYRWYADFDRNF